jgi:hypothetical protein
MVDQILSAGAERLQVDHDIREARQILFCLYERDVRQARSDLSAIWNRFRVKPAKDLQADRVTESCLTSQETEFLVCYQAVASYSQICLPACLNMHETRYYITFIVPNGKSTSGTLQNDIARKTKTTKQDYE